jgi:hypothetical protein
MDVDAKTKEILFLKGRINFPGSSLTKRYELKKIEAFIDSDVAIDPGPAANTAVPAEFAGFSGRE